MSANVPDRDPDSPPSGEAFRRRAAEARAFVARIDESLLDTSGVDTTLHDLTLSRSVMGRLEGAIDRHKFVVAPGRTIRVGVSLGAATFPADGRGHDELLAVASARRLDRLLARRRRPEDAERHLRFPGRSDLPVN